MNLPRISNNPESPYRPRNFVATWALLCDMLEEALGTGNSNNTLLGAFFRSGWLSAAGEEPAILPPNSPNLTVKLRDGVRIIHNGIITVVDGDTMVSGAPADATSYLTLEYSTGEDGGDVWTPTWHTEWPALGAGVLATVTTDNDAVIEVDGSETGSDLIWEYPALAARLRNHETRLAALEGGGSGGGGEAAYTGLGPWLPSPGDNRPTHIAILEIIAAMIAAQGGANAIRENPEYRALIAELGSQGLGIAEVNPDSTLRSTATTVMIGVTGDGSGGTIDDLEEGTANVDEEAQTIGP